MTKNANSIFRTELHPTWPTWANHGHFQGHRKKKNNLRLEKLCCKFVASTAGEKGGKYFGLKIGRKVAKFGGST